MLLQIREYIRRERLVSNQQIARALQIDLLALEPMLSLLVTRGVLRHAQETAGCAKPCSGMSCQNNAQPLSYYCYP